MTYLQRVPAPSLLDTFFDDSWPFFGLDRFSRPRSLSAVSGRGINLDVSRQNGAYVVQAEVPGVAKDDLKVRLENDVLQIAISRESDGSDDSRVLRRERFSGSATRRLTLPERVDASKAESRLENGVLTLTLPLHESTRETEIPIQ